MRITGRNGGRRVGGSRRHRLGALLVGAVTVGAAFATTATAGAGVSNPGAISVHFAGTLSINASVAVVIPGISGDATGTIDSAGNVALPQANVSFSSFPVTLAGVLPTTVAIQPLGDWTGSLDADGGAMTLAAPLNAVIDLSGLGLGSACPIGPITLALTTGVSGTAHGTAYNPTTGGAEIVDGTFPIPAVPTAPAPAGCPGAATLNSLAPLPVAANVSTADFTVTITPHPFGSTTTTTTTTPPPPAPTVSVGNGAILEGDAGTHTLNIPVTLSLSKATTKTVKMHFAVSGVSAVAGDGHDFKGTMSGTLSIAAGVRQAAIKLTVFARPGSAANKTLKVVLSSLVGPTGSKIVRSTGVGTLINP